jgi:hypothetical protein
MVSPTELSTGSSLARLKATGYEGMIQSESIRKKVMFLLALSGTRNCRRFKASSMHKLP